MSSSPSSGTGVTRRLFTALLALELGILLAMSVLLPFLIHVLPAPDGVRLGPRLLPMFYAPLIAALLARYPSAFVVGAAAPWLNFLLTGHPSPVTANVILSVQLLAFVGILRLLLARLGPRWFLALPAYVGCMLVVLALVAVWTSLIHDAPALSWVREDVLTGLPGVGAMVLINWLVIRFYPTRGDDKGPVAA